MSAIAAFSQRKQAGFTIVELLIVIVVIAILAAISIVAYTGIQARASDSRMRSAAAQIEKALQIYSVDYGPGIPLGGSSSTAVTSGNPCTDGVNGFFGTTSYLCSVEDSLVAYDLLPGGFTLSLPANTYFGTQTNGSRSFMLYNCAAAGSYGLYWTLRSPTAADTSSIDSTLSSCGNNVMIRDTWGMRAGRVLKL